MKLEEITNGTKQLDEDFGTISSGVAGLLLGLLITDAAGIMGAGAQSHESSFWQALKKSRFAASKMLMDAIKKKLTSMRLKRQVQRLANDPEVQEMIDNNMQGRSFKKGKKAESMELLYSKVDEGYDEIRELLDMVVQARKET